MNISDDQQTLLIGCAAGFSGDRVDAAGPVVDTLIARGLPSFLIFETLAERTLAFAQLARRQHPDSGYEPLLSDMLRPVLARCMSHGIRIVSNFGAANPASAARRIAELAMELGISVPRIAVVNGDDVSGPLHRNELRKALGDDWSDEPIVAANAYLGGDAIAAALNDGAQIVVTGRVADPSLAVGPIMSYFGWRSDDWERIGRAVLAGHLLECGAQITGGYFADPGYKDVPDLHNVGFPILEIAADGSCVVGKAEGTGGLVSEQTVKEQILYEMHDPAAYLSPDAVADVSRATARSVGVDRVEVSGVTGHARPKDLKVNVYYDGGWLAEGEISYAGPRAEARARLAADVLCRRLGPELQVRVDLIGVRSVFSGDRNETWRTLAAGQASDVRLRVAAAHRDEAEARKLVREVNALYTCGPAGGGGVRTAMRQRLTMRSCLIPRDAAVATYEMVS